MTAATAGIPVTLVSRFELNGTATDPELPLTLTVVPAAGGDPVLATQDLTRVSAGVFTYSWTPGAVDNATDYVVTFDPDGDDVAAVEVLTVLPATAYTWASVEQVSQVTGLTVTAETVALASSIITTVTGADPEMPADAITAKDRVHLRRATAWQAVWIPTKPGLITDRESSTSVTSDAQNIQREDRMDNLLAPLARREIMSLSWVGTRTSWRPPVSLTVRNRNFLNEASDPSWLGGEGAFQ